MNNKNNIITGNKIEGFSRYLFVKETKQVFDLVQNKFLKSKIDSHAYSMVRDNSATTSHILLYNIQRLATDETVNIDLTKCTVNLAIYPTIPDYSDYHYLGGENHDVIRNDGRLMKKSKDNRYNLTMDNGEHKRIGLRAMLIALLEENKIDENYEPILIDTDEKNIVMISTFIYRGIRTNNTDHFVEIEQKIKSNKPTYYELNEYEKVDISKLETFAQSDLFPQRIEQELINKLAQQNKQLTFVETDKTIGAKYIPNTTNRYIITKTGVIYDLSKNKIIKPHQLVHNKYASVQIYINNKLTSKNIHSLMAQSWIMEDYIERGYVCKHLDNNKHNYNLENLMIDSYQNNTRDAINDGLMQGWITIGENGKPITSDTILYKIDGLSNYGFDNENGVIYDLNTGIGKSFTRNNNINLIDDNNTKTRVKLQTLFDKCKLLYKNIPHDAVLLKDIKPKDTNKTQEDFKYNYYLTKSGEVYSTFSGKKLDVRRNAHDVDTVSLYGRTYSLPKLMIETFVYKNYSSHIPKLWINFEDGDKSNCSIDNLKLTTTLTSVVQNEERSPHAKVELIEVPKDAVAIPLSYLDNKYYITKDAIVYSTPKGNHNGIILKHSIGSKGYVTVSLSGKNHEVHQIMAITFLDKDYKDKGLVVGHKDENKLNNKLSNLHLITVAQNNKDAREHREQFAEISGYSRYRLTNDERVYDLLLQTYVSNANKNQSFRLYKDDGKISNLKIKSILNLVTPYSYKNLTNADMEYFLNNKDLQIGIIFDKYMVCKNRMVLDINAKLPILPTKNNYFKLINEKNELVSFRINQLIDMIQTKNIPNTPNTPNTHDINSSDTTTDWITLNDDRFNGYQVKLDNGEVKVLGLRYNKEIKPRSKTSFRLKNNTIKIDTIKELILDKTDK